MNNNYYYYIEEVNKLNVLEKITYELINFQESDHFKHLYQEELESQKQDGEIVDRTIAIAKKFSVEPENVNMLKKAFIYFKPELKETIDSYLFDLQIATSFGLGIGTLIPSVLLFLEKAQINISYENAILLSVGVIMGVIYTQKRETYKIKMLFKKLFLVIRNKKLKKTFTVIKILAKKLWVPLDKFLEFLAYTMMAIPLSNVLLSFLKQNKFDPDLISQSLNGLAIAGLLQLLRRTPKLFNKFSRFFKMKRKL
jgi:hypothetical protein